MQIKKVLCARLQSGDMQSKGMQADLHVCLPDTKRSLEPAWAWHRAGVPYAHALLNVCRRYLVAQAHHKLHTGHMSR